MTVPFMLFLVPPFLLILWLHRSWPAESRRSQTILFLSGFRRPAAGGGAYEKSSRFPGAAKEPDRPHGTKNRCSSERTGESTTKIGVAMPGPSFIPPEYSRYPGILDSLRYPEYPMNSTDLNWIANYIWGIADDVLRDLYVRGKYRDVILPMTVLRRLDVVLEDSEASRAGDESHSRRGGCSRARFVPAAGGGAGISTTPRSSPCAT